MKIIDFNSADDKFCVLVKADDGLVWIDLSNMKISEAEEYLELREEIFAENYPLQSSRVC